LDLAKHGLYFVVIERGEAFLFHGIAFFIQAKTKIPIPFSLTASRTMKEPKRTKEIGREFECGEVVGRQVLVVAPSQGSSVHRTSDERETSGGGGRKLIQGKNVPFGCLDLGVFI
jgi:hypothetical protein